MKSLWIEKTIKYDGTQLRSLFAYLQHGVLGDSIVGFRGACEVTLDHMVDGEDLLAKSEIRGSDMLHFIVEVFDRPLWGAIAFQRLMAATMMEVLQKNLKDTNTKTQFTRRGDDIFWNEGKLSISIATRSPNSSVIHFAVNCRNAGTPVKTAALEDFDLDPKAIAQEFLARVSKEGAEILEATQKVKPVP
ncbi:MAG: DUF366 family protein [Pseudobdellovibrionaceae bacterium]